MMQSFAVALVRAWTRIYTWGMAPRAREARVAEIESDLWESVQGGDRVPEILARLVLGIVDDLVWRTTHDLIRETSARRTAAFGLIVTAATVLLVAALWFIDAVRAAQLPEPPAVMHFMASPAPPPPPPPPPPPCDPPAFGGCNANASAARRAR
jgi:hypothetical protein